MVLSMFLEHVERNLCDLSYQFSAETLDHMYRATQQIVEQVVDDIGRIKPHLKVKEVISIGSFAEGTKICSPNEFDFLACFDFLSKKENVPVTFGLSHQENDCRSFTNNWALMPLS